MIAANFIALDTHAASIAFAQGLSQVPLVLAQLLAGLPDIAHFVAYASLR